MTDPLDAEDPVRWSAGGGPPGTADFLRTIERPSALPPAIRTDLRGRLSRAVRPPAPRWITPTTVASAVGVGGVILWILQPASPPPELPLLPEVAPEEPAPSAPSELGSPGAPDAVPTIEPVVAADEPRPAPEASPRAATSRGTGRLLVNSTPWSEVFLDDEPLGPTPVMRDVRPGRYTLRFESSEGVREEIEIEVAAGESLRVVRDLHRPSAEPAPVPEETSSDGLAVSPVEAERRRPTGTLTVLSIPWARVYVDGEDTGHTTPLLRYRLPAGEHRLGLRTSDGVLHSETVTIEAGQATRVSRALELGSGAVVDPPGSSGSSTAGDRPGGLVTDSPF